MGGADRSTKVDGHHLGPRKVAVIRSRQVAVKPKVSGHNRQVAAYRGGR